MVSFPSSTNHYFIIGEFQVIKPTKEESVPFFVKFTKGINILTLTRPTDLGKHQEVSQVTFCGISSCLS